MPAGGNKHPRSGFQPGHPPYYRGGSVHGHAPTNPGGTTWSLPKNDLVPHQYGKPTSRSSREGNGMPATGKQRECMEAIQNLESLDERAIKKLVQRFPRRMVYRLVALQEAAEDPSGQYFLQAQRLVREILIAPKRRFEVPGAAPDEQREPDEINILHGHVDVPLPGGSGDPADAQGDSSASAGPESASPSPKVNPAGSS